MDSVELRKDNKAMVCKACGRKTENENANYCEYCGTPFRENIAFKQEETAPVYMQQSVDSNTDEKEESEKPISFGNWMGTMLLPFIPIIGFFIYPVMLFVWAFGSDTPPSKKNWARASLIVSAIVIVAVFFMVTTVLMDVMNSGMNMNDYMNQLYKNQL
jgi:ribosomal protein L37E